MKANKPNEATPGVATRRKLTSGAAEATLAFTPALTVFSADSSAKGNCCRRTSFRFGEDEIIQTGYGFLT